MELVAAQRGACPSRTRSRRAPRTANLAGKEVGRERTDQGRPILRPQGNGRPGCQEVELPPHGCDEEAGEEYSGGQDEEPHPPSASSCAAARKSISSRRRRGAPRLRARGSTVTTRSSRARSLTDDIPHDALRPWGSSKLRDGETSSTAQDPRPSQGKAGPSSRGFPLLPGISLAHCERPVPGGGEGELARPSRAIRRRGQGRDCGQHGGIGEQDWFDGDPGAPGAAERSSRA